MVMKGTKKIFPLLLLIVWSFRLMETLPIRVEYELRYHPEPSSGLLTLSCLKNHNPVEMSEVKIWLNRTSVEDMDIRNRTDVQVVEVTLYNMTIDFTRKIEGDFSCGTATWDIQESERAAVVDLQKNVQVKDSAITSIAATVGDKAVLHCPIERGAYREHYSVQWLKGSTVIAHLISYQDFNSMDPRFNIDRNDLSLIINPVRMNDSSFSYRCRLSVVNPRSHNGEERTVLATDISTTLLVNSKPSISPSTVALRSHKERPSFTCSVNYTGGHAPNITWMYVKDGMELALNEGDYLSKSSCIDREGGTSTKHNTLTSLNLDLPVGKSAIVRCKVGHGLQRATADAFMVNINGQEGTCQKEPATVEVKTLCTCH